MCFAGSVPSKKILHCANISFRAYANAQPCRHTTNQVFQVFNPSGLFGISLATSDVLTSDLMFS